MLKLLIDAQVIWIHYFANELFSSKTFQNIASSGSGSVWARPYKVVTMENV